MKITFFSNFLSQLQTPFCDEMYDIFGKDFTFVSTIETPKLILDSGYPDCTNYSYNLNAYSSDKNYKDALCLGIESDIVIIGAAPEIFIKERLISDKHTFRYSERVLKDGYFRLFDPRVILSLFKTHTQHRNKNLYMLCAGEYAGNDLNLICAYPNKKFKWGYFTLVSKLDIDKTLKNKTKIINLLWVARFIDWKHPELVVKLAFELKRKGYLFHLNMVGTGLLFDSIRNLINQLGLSDYISLLGNMPNNKVRKLMLKSNIFILTSDKREGWGAVLNEALSSGCACVVSDQVGSVSLIEDNVNGLLFKSGNLRSLVRKVELIFFNDIKREQIAKKAYNKMISEWSQKRAAKNFIKLVGSIINNRKFIIKKGPCSRL